MLKVLKRPEVDINLDDKSVNMNKIKIFYMEDDGGNPLVSPVDPELKVAQRKVIDKWKSCYGHQAQRLSLKRMAYAPIIWVTQLVHSAPPEQPPFSKELTDLDGTEICASLEMFKWMLGRSEHTLPAIVLALFDNKYLIDDNSDIHQVIASLIIHCSH